MNQCHSGTSPSRSAIEPESETFFSSSLKIFVIFLITQLLHSEALPCDPGEYEIDGECCPMCSAGSRVLRHCRPSSSTTCMPCVDDTYTEHPNGLTQCMRCKVCDAGARLMVKEKCTYTKNTVCGCAPGDFCSRPAWLDCGMCSASTICIPGSKVKISGTEFRDNICEVCPDGTFSATNMSHTCQPWTKCEEEGMTEGEAGTATSDAVCVKRGLSATGLALDELNEEVVENLIRIGKKWFTQHSVFRKLLKTLAHPPFTAPEQRQEQMQFFKVEEEREPLVSPASDRG